ncbi:MAG: succinic semialdehyde dehydrogenase [Candidatus Nanopelagicales bacterium]|nr:succinic semialdehyde dehydrogenase [Candidatus Nanopelagicales bacterium]
MTIAPEKTAAQVAGIDVKSLIAQVVAAPKAETLHSISPFTLEPLAEIPISTAEDVDLAFETARRAQKRWAQWTPKERAKIILRFHDIMLEHRSTTLDLIQAENGKARSDASEEFLDVLLTSRHYARVAPKKLAPVRHRGVLPVLTSVSEIRHPKGVVGVIAPWNYPLTLAVSDAIPALLAGNGIVLKPDSQTALTALWAVRLLHEAGLPVGLVQVVVGPGPIIGPAIVKNADYLMFTGSTPVGRQLAEQCGERLISCSMELGGKNAMLVLADADIERASEIAVRACFSNAGQLCISMERMYINEKIYDAFVARFVERVRGMRLQAGVGWGSDMGSLINEKQLKTVTEHVEDALAKGATALVGGKARPDIGPLYFEPTVLEGVTHEMRACINETFGPVVSLYKVQNDEEAIDRANDTEYGLNGSVLTRDTKHGRKVAARLKAGTVNVNEGYASAWGTTSAPMGGMGASGIGRRHGTEGLLKYTESQTVAVQKLVRIAPQFGMDDEQWAHFMTASLAAMKKMGMS